MDLHKINERLSIDFYPSHVNVWDNTNLISLGPSEVHDVIKLLKEWLDG